jgi:uncharacterized protein (TIGR03435 family)
MKRRNKATNAVQLQMVILSIACLILLSASSPTALAQAAATSGTPSAAISSTATAKLEFEAATIKPDQPRVGSPPSGVKIYPDRVVIDLLSFKRLICVAFNIDMWQLQGGEDWTDKDLFAVEAKPPVPSKSNPYSQNHSTTSIGDERLRQMMQALLIDRFQLKFHHETKTGTISILEKSGKPLLLKPSKGLTEEDQKHAPGFFGTIGASPKGWGIFNTSMPQLAAFLGSVLRHPVIDKTGLDSSYDFRSTVALTPEDFQSGPNSFLPVVGEMGLKLSSSKGPVESFVIDHAEHPSPN